MKKWLPLVLVVGLVACLGTPAEAGVLSLVGGDISMWTPVAGEASPSLIIGLTNSVAGDTERLQAWQVTFDIVPGAGATGVLNFHSAFVPTTDYVLAGQPTFFGTTFPNDPARDRIRAVDSDISTVGLSVPASGANLVGLKFVSPAGDALGNFDLFAVPGGGNTLWTEITTVQQREFQGLPFTGSPLAVGGINAIPEPSACALAVIGIGTLAIFGRRRQRRKDETA